MIERFAMDVAPKGFKVIAATSAALRNLHRIAGRDLRFHYLC